MIGKIDHVGIAVKDTEAALRFYRDVLGIRVAHSEAVPSDGVRITFLPVGESQIEFVEPLNDASSTAKFIERRGEGIHHICLEVDDIEATLKEMERQGMALIDRVPRKGGHGKLVAFVHPKSTSGVLIELAQSTSAAHLP